MEAAHRVGRRLTAHAQRSWHARRYRERTFLGGPVLDLSGGAREDRTRSLRASVFNRAFTLRGFSPELAIVHQVRDTNAQLYDYRRTCGELRFVRRF